MTPEQREELKPCPFCGGEAQTDFIEGESYIIECYVCRAETGIKDSEDEAITAWNRRAQVEALTVRAERAERALVRGGFVDHGAQEWKPPLGPAPKFIEVEALTVPQGWKLVPVEPTAAMYDAAGESLYGHSRADAIEWAKEDKFESQADSGCDAYRAMLLAAPTIPAIPGTKEGA